MIRCFDPYIPSNDPEQYTNDVALAKLSHSQPTEDWVTVSWNDKPIPRNAKLFLLGRKRLGEYAGVESQNLMNPLEGILGGWRFVREPDTGVFRTSVIWRCKDTSITGDSGALVVMKDDIKEEWVGVAFQSHELSHPMAPFEKEESRYWKIALKPPGSLIQTYRSIAPPALIDALDK